MLRPEGGVCRRGRVDGGCGTGRGARLVARGRHRLGCGRDRIARQLGTGTVVAAQRELRGLLNRRHELLSHRESFAANRDFFWVDERDGDPFLKAQSLISNTAKSSGVTLSSLGAARSDKISDGAQFVSFSIKGQAPFKQIVKFILELDKSHPKAYWKSMILRPDNPRAPKAIVLSGTIQFIRISDEAALELLFEKSN